MSVTVDARGVNCPTPVIKTKNAMETNPAETIITIVNNVAARENVKRLAENSGYHVALSEKEGDYYLLLSKASCIEAECSKKQEQDSGSFIIYIPADKMGQGSDDLGRVLIKGYFYALTEAKPYPKSILFVNAGVKLTTLGSEVIEHIKLLEDNGVEILSCGTCLDFFGIKKKLAAGSITNMYNIVESMNEASKVIRL